MKFMFHANTYENEDVGKLFAANYGKIMYKRSRLLLFKEP